MFSPQARMRYIPPSSTGLRLVYPLRSCSVAGSGKRDNVSSPKTRLSWGRGSRARYERVLKRIQLSRPSRTACCITNGGTTQAHTAREHVGSLSWKDWTFRRMLVEVRKGADSPKPPQERGLQGRSHAAEAAPTCSSGKSACLRGNLSNVLYFRGGRRHGRKAKEGRS